MKRYRIGRADTNDIVLSDRSVSREHAELTTITRGVFLLRDLNSTYGTSARQGLDWHLVTAENVSYDTPVRIGEFETTVARLLHEVDPLAVYMDSPEPSWVTSSPRLTPDERDQQPETIHVDWTGPAPLFTSPPEPRHSPSMTRRFAKLAPVGILAIAALALLAAAVMRA